MMKPSDDASASCDICGVGDMVRDGVCRACGSAVEDASADALMAFVLPEGASLRDGAYVVEQVLGQGGFGITYACRDTVNGRHVAIKEYFPWGCSRRDGQVEPGGEVTPEEFCVGRDKFGDEAQMLTQFLAPNNFGIVDVFEVFEANNTSYMVMELLRGQTLAQILEARGGMLSTEETAPFLEAVGTALSAVHHLNVLHRDIKPENVMVCEAAGGERPRVVLMDFGSARVIEANRFGTGVGKRLTTLLTPGYAPLEQYGAEQSFGPYTDIYALGALGYHLLTGQIPTQATDRAAGVELWAPHRINSAIDLNLSGAIMWAMQMKVHLRPQSVEDFLAVLRSPTSFDAASYLEEAPVEDAAPLRPPDELLPSTIRESEKGWFTVSVPQALLERTSRLLWPDRCACCGEPAQTTMSNEGYPLTEVPYCLACQAHMHHSMGWAVSETLSAPVRGIDSSWAALVSIASTFFGVGMILQGSTYEPGALTWGASLIGVALMSATYVVWKCHDNISPEQEQRARQQGTISPTCAALGPAVEWRGFNYGSLVLTFKNRNYARDFRNANVQQAFGSVQQAFDSVQQAPLEPALAALDVRDVGVSSQVIVDAEAQVITGIEAPDAPTRVPPPALPEYTPMATERPKAWPHRRQKSKVPASKN